MRIINCPHCHGTGVVLDVQLPAEAPTSGADVGRAWTDAYVAARAELPPPMPIPSHPVFPVPQDEPPHPAAQVGPGQFPPAGVSVGTCSQGHPWKTVPAGVSQRNGKAYSAFTVCDDRDHGERPR